MEQQKKPRDSAAEDAEEIRRELYEERAAILEHMAGLPRAEAERVALAMYALAAQKDVSE